mmetsp:Transcript_46789/g.84501  ORF Transcript_46789/g.84501 Transcript_46789/m.84501 type:complete len:235 (+) Transcript_46789:309-1013(+)
MERHCISGRSRQTMKQSSVSQSSGGTFSGSSGMGRARSVSFQPFFLDTPVSRQFSWKTSSERSETCCRSFWRRGSVFAVSPAGAMFGITSSASRLALAKAASAVALASAARAAAASLASALASSAASSTAACASASWASMAACFFSSSISCSIPAFEASFSCASASKAKPLVSAFSMRASMLRSFFRSARIRFSVAVSGLSFSTYSGSGTASGAAAGSFELFFLPLEAEAGGVL